MAFLPRSSEEEEEGSWPSNSPGSPWKPDASNQVKSLWDDQDIQVSSQKPRPPSITVETTDINEVESGELRWPPEELLLSDSEEEEDEAFFQDQDEESGWAWCPLDPRSSLRTLNPGSDWEEEEETWGESDTSWISGAEKEAVQAAPGAETGAAAAAPGGRGGGGRGAHYAPPSQEAGVQCPGQHHPIWEEEKETFATDQACPEGEGCHGSGSPPEARQDH
ncbi:LBH domain-containing protein 1-like isoform X1 [Notamacropus eugenii]|uniref:LBH domain-containing protein 1-like isoform X1 n=1 Tax=Notamacropus eugenii TaxID=9315 RepID=UPI003B6819A4